MIYEAGHHKYVRLLAEAEYYKVETLCGYINTRKHGEVGELDYCAYRMENSKAVEASA